LHPLIPVTDPGHDHLTAATASGPALAPGPTWADGSRGLLGLDDRLRLPVERQDAGATAGASAVQLSGTAPRWSYQPGGIAQLFSYRPDRASRPSQRMSAPTRTGQPHRDRAGTPCPIYSAAPSGGPPAANAPPRFSATDQCAPLADRFHPITELTPRYGFSSATL
jgi:hypothetical protein